jgi:hypothetical protein
MTNCSTSWMTKNWTTTNCCSAVEVEYYSASASMAFAGWSDCSRSGSRQATDNSPQRLTPARRAVVQGTPFCSLSVHHNAVS